MFYEGSLQNGIAKAIEQSKFVACFVTDSGAESQEWENDFLQHRELKDLLFSQAVLLRLEAQSQEAGYLAAIYPLPKTPTFVVISNGQLREYLVAGIDRDDFLRRAIASLRNHTSPGATSSSGQSSSALNSESNASQIAIPERTQSPAVQTLLEERKRKIEAQRKTQEAQEKKERAAKAAAREAEVEAAAAADPKKSADLKYAKLEKTRQQEAREERARILKRVEDDKIERRQRDSLRLQQALLTEVDETSGSQAASSPFRPIVRNASNECAVQVRLFDGSTMRSRFSAQQNLRADVRKWVDEQRGNEDVPYTFKQILTPSPSRNISISEEEESLQSLGLCPSTTLVLVEVKQFTSAYQESAAGLMGRGVTTGYGLVSSGLGIVTGALGSFFGSSTTQQETVSVNAQTTSPQANRSKREDHQLYNGNNLNFEPRPEDKDD